MGKQYSNRINSHLQKTIQTHNAVSVAISGYSLQANFIDCDGFDKLGITLLNDGSSSASVDVVWSNDGSSLHGQESGITSGSGIRRAGIVDIKARYAKIQLNNADATLAHTMSAWVFLKA